MCDKKFYTLRLKCENCDHEWEAQIKHGCDFVASGVTISAYVAPEGRIYYGDHIKCPHCGSGKIVKAERAATYEVQVDHARESWPGYGTRHSILQVNEDNTVMSEKWRPLLLDSGSDYAYEIMTKIEDCDEYREVCSIKGRKGAALDIVNAMIYMRPIVEAVVGLEKTIGTDERLFVSAMSKLRGLLLSSGLAKVKEQGKCNPTPT